MQLLLDLPQISPELAKVVETDAAKLRSWLIGLPTADITVAARQIHDALTSLNRIELAVEPRIKLLSEYESMLELLAGSFEVASQSSGVPMKESARLTAMLHRNLWLEMATGWKIVLVGRLEKRSLFGSAGKADPQLVLRIMQSFWRFYRLNSRLYLPMPAGIWVELHQLFRFSVKNQFLDEPREPKNRSIACLYKHILLFSLADPLRFAAPEQDKVVELVESYGHLAHFQSVSRLAGTAGYFLIELDSDKPPRFIGSRSIDPALSGGILFDTTELSRHLHKTEAAIEAKAPQAHDRVRLLARLQILRRVLRQWAIAPQRVFQRIPSHSLVEMALGLPAVVSHLNEAAGAVSKELLALRNPVQSMGWQVEPQTLPMSLSSWQVINESPGGFAVRAVAVSDEQVHAGDVVALHAQHGPWLVASVRWLQTDDNNGIEMGLQILSSKAIPALIRPLSPDASQAYLPALLLPEIPTLQQPARIAASKGTYIPMHELTVITPAEEKKVRALKLIEQQMGYDLFEYQQDSTAIK